MSNGKFDLYLKSKDENKKPGNSHNQSERRWVDRRGIVVSMGKTLKQRWWRGEEGKRRRLLGQFLEDVYIYRERER
ncbi:hypothetical protein L1887_27329 [Cichorium endivia]|nr:hypothetical protein L1887_27329 [Cichorium endivia]